MLTSFLTGVWNCSQQGGGATTKRRMLTVCRLRHWFTFSSLKRKNPPKNNSFCHPCTCVVQRRWELRSGGGARLSRTALPVAIIFRSTPMRFVLHKQVSDRGGQKTSGLPDVGLAPLHQSLHPSLSLSESHRRFSGAWGLFHIRRGLQTVGVWTFLRNNRFLR